MSVVKGQKLKRPNLPPKLNLKRGRPTVYEPGMDENVRRLCLLGLSDAEIAEYLGISAEVLWKWDNKHPSFVNARAEGRIKADARVASSLYDRATGLTIVKQQAVKLRDGENSDKIEIVEITEEIIPDTHAAALWLSNRQRGRWSIKPIDPASEGPEGGGNAIKITGGLPDE